jgi:hypothetical protein
VSFACHHGELPPQPPDHRSFLIQSRQQTARTTGKGRHVLDSINVLGRIGDALQRAGRRTCGECFIRRRRHLAREVRRPMRVGHQNRAPLIVGSDRLFGEVYSAQRAVTQGGRGRLK